MQDNVIIEQLKNREESGLRLLIQQYGGYVGAIVSNLCRGALSRQDVEELTADVFLAIWNHSEALRPDSPLKPYLAQTARNTAISRLRQQKIPPLAYDDQIGLPDQSGGPDDLTIRNEQQEILNAAVSRLGQPEQEIFVRYYFLGEPIKAISTQLGLSQTAVKTKLFRSRKKLKQSFEERGYRYEEAN